MKLKINYWDVFKGIVVCNLFAVLGVQVTHIDRRGIIPNQAIPYVLVIFNLLLFFGKLANPPLRFIEIDKQANRLTYAFLFHYPEAVDYMCVQSEWVTKNHVGRLGASTENILVFKLNNQEVFSLSEASTGWSKEQLDCIHEAVLNKG